MAINKYKIRQLEHRLLAHRTVIQQFEETQVKREEILFAIEDYESAKVAWDESKKKYNSVVSRAMASSNYNQKHQQQLQRSQEKGMNQEVVGMSSKCHTHHSSSRMNYKEPGKNADLVVESADSDSLEETLPPMPPSIEERFFMVQSLANDLAHCSRVVERIQLVCALTNNQSFNALRDSYVKLEAELRKTNDECVELISLLPSSMVPMKGEIGTKRTYPEEMSFGPFPMDATEFHASSLFPDMEFMGSRDHRHLPRQRKSRSEHEFDEARNEEDELSWCEYNTDTDIDAIEPTMDNLELRSNLLLRKRMRDSANTADRWERRLAEATAADEESSTRNAHKAGVRFEDPYSIHTNAQITSSKVGGYELAVNLATTAASMSVMEEFIPEEIQYNDEDEDEAEKDSEERRGYMNTVDQKIQWAELDHIQCDATLYCEEIDRQEADQVDDPWNEELSDAGEGTVEYAVEYAGVQIDMDNMDAAMVLDEIIAEVIIRAEKESISHREASYKRPQKIVAGPSMATTDLNEVSAMEGLTDRRGGDGRVLDALDGLVRAVADAGVEAGVNGANPVVDAGVNAGVGAIVDAGVDVGVEAGANAVVAAANQLQNEAPNGFAVPPLVPPGNNNNPRNEEALQIYVILGGFLAVTGFVASVLLLPALCGELFLRYTAAGVRVSTWIKDAIGEAIHSEDTYVHLMQLMSYMEHGGQTVLDSDSAERAQVAEVIIANLHGLARVFYGYSFFVLLAASIFAAYCVYFTGNFEPTVRAVDVMGIIKQNIAFVYKAVNSISKVGLLIFTMNIIVPLALTALTAMFLNNSLPPYLRTTSFENFSFLVLFALFVFSSMFNQHVLTITNEVRRAIDGRYLVGILPDVSMMENIEADDGVNNMQRISAMSYSFIIKRIIIRICVLLPAYVCGVVVPIRLGHYICPIAQESLRFRMKPSATDMQLPVEMLLSHIFIPIIVDKLRYSAVVKSAVEGFLGIFAPWLGLHWILAQANPPADPLAPPPPLPVEEQVRMDMPAQQVLHAPVPIPVQEPLLFAVDIPDEQTEQIIPAESQRDLPDHTFSETGVDTSNDSSHDDGIEAFDINNNADTASTMHYEQDTDGILENPPERVEGTALTNELIHSAIDIANNDDARAVPAEDQALHTPTATVPPTAMAAPPLLVTTSSSIPTPIAATMLLILGFTYLAVISSWVLHAPLVTGRAVLELVRLPTHNDLFNFPVGLLLCWGVGFVFHFIWKDISRHAGAQGALSATTKWVLLTAQTIAVGVLWLAVPPLLLGILLEVLFVVPLRVPLYETPLIPFIQNWALGLIILKAFTKCVLSGMFGDIDLRTQLEMVIIRGFAQFDAKVTMQRVVVPVTLFLLDLLLMPYALASCACAFTQSYQVRTILLRYCYHANIAAQLLGFGTHRTITALVKLYNEVRDSKYLIGTQLTNRAR
eukprot:CAMPEP_0170412666 /NCGR_PEP_ID=MMETSP0117_2-20130122/31099_1 /TAXON_ID=400756 /ORGANISM="Durinskia baltica, Strain CSIRO CS-38" /LENGTH=1434 /DNA_ID=CAMNT_0010670389 /DNA_START=607 /DNA_END=4911 /DNA_ORIENTATION=+